MKCDELKRVKDSFWVLKGKGTPVTSADGYNADEVDEAIAELKEKIKIYEDFGSCKTGCPALRHNQRRIEREIYKSKLKDKELAELNDKVNQYKTLYNEKCRDINTQERLFAEQIAQLREATRWRKYPEEKPNDGQVVWAYEADSNRVLTLEYEKTDEGEGFICFPYKQDSYTGITHWMPYNKPKAPEELDEKVH